VAGTLTFPPGLDVAIEREIVTDVKVDRSESGFEVRTRWNATPRYKFKFKVTGRTNVSGTNEAKALTDFYEANSGEWDAFNMTDPFNGTAVLVCRFIGAFKMKRALTGGPRGAWWECSFEVQSVVQPS
jgi:hypothetical protein